MSVLCGGLGVGGAALDDVVHHPHTRPLPPALDVLARQDAAADAADAARLARLDAAAPVVATAEPASDSTDAPRLSRALLESVALHGAIMVTWANAAYTDFTLNWVAHVRGAGVTNYLVGALDDETLATLRSAGVPSFAMHAGLPASDFGWGSASFHEMGRRKAALTAAVTGFGFDVLVSDVDTAWLSNPFPYLSRFPDADALVSSDTLASSLPPGDDRLEAWPVAGAAFNIGVLFVRATRGGRALAAAWHDTLAASPPGAWDQAVFNEVARGGVDLESVRGDHLFWCANGTALLGVLPVADYASGHTFFVQRLAERGSGEAAGLLAAAAGGGDAARAPPPPPPPHPTVVHATFQFSGTPGKRHRLRERRLWAVDPPEYYDPPGGLLALDLDLGGLIHAAAVPDAPLDPDLPPSTRLAPFEGHFALVHAQLRQLRAGLALAAALNRTLILPRFWCGADRWWAPHAGRLPGADHPRLPFRCPADHVLDLEAWAKAGPGPWKPELREAGLLTHPRTPARVRGDVVRVAPCDAAAHLACSTGDGAPALEVQPGWVRLQRGLSDRAITTALAPHAHRRVMTFTDAAASLGGFEGGDAVAAAAAAALASLTSIWCCTAAPPHAPGHVWYDPHADTVPHVDRHGRVFEGEWVPLLGP